MKLNLIVICMVVVEDNMCIGNCFIFDCNL